MNPARELSRQSFVKLEHVASLPQIFDSPPLRACERMAVPDTSLRLQDTKPSRITRCSDAEHCDAIALLLNFALSFATRLSLKFVVHISIWSSGP